MRDEGSQGFAGRSAARDSAVSLRRTSYSVLRHPHPLSSTLRPSIPHPSSLIPHPFSFFSVCFGPASAQQLALLRKMPAELLRYTGGARPDADGMVGYNRGGFKSPEFQGGAMHYWSAPWRRKTSGESRRAGGRSTPRSASRPKSGNFGRHGASARRPLGRGLLVGRIGSGHPRAPRKRTGAEV